MSITYLEGDATTPRRPGENDCPCLLAQETKCGASRCYHFTGEGSCTACLFSSGLTAAAMTVDQALWYISRMFRVEFKPVKEKPSRKKPTLFRQRPTLPQRGQAK